MTIKPVYLLRVGHKFSFNSLVAPKEAVTSVNSTHEASGTDLWVLGLKETRSDRQTCALWCASMCHSWVENVTH